MNWQKTTARIQSRALLPLSFVVLLGWTHSGRAVEPSLPFDPNNLPDRRLTPNYGPTVPFDPTSDPSRPSNRPLILPSPETDETAKAKSQSLKLPGEPLESKEKSKDNVPRLALKKVIFEGNVAIPTDELDEVAKPFLNRRLTGNDVEDLRYKLTLYYVGKGFINSGAVIPEQTVKDGELRIKIIEGRLSDVRLTGQGWLREEYIRDRIMDDSDKPLNTNDLQERYLMLLNDPLIERLNGSLLPGLHPGDAILDLKVARTRPYGGYLGADNYAPPSIGGYAGRIGAWVGNLSGFGERIDFNFSAMGGANMYNTGLDIPLTAKGTRFAFHYTYSDTLLIEQPFNTLNIHSSIISYDGQLSHPVLWNLQQKLTLGFNFNVRQDVTTLDGKSLDRPGSHNGQNQETVVRTWQDYVHQGKEFDLALRSTLSVGVDALGANITTQTGDGRFFDWLGQGVGRYRFLSNGAFVSLSGAVQLANDTLLPLEKIAIGGVYTVRGYRQNYLVRDEGFYTALEVSYPLYGSEPGSIHGMNVVPFVNFGGAWDYGNAANNPLTKATYLWSTGVGLDWHYSSLSASLYWAQRLSSYALTKGTPYDLQDNGITFQANWRVF
jgi:hemolysin activation/secretion protein